MNQNLNFIVRMAQPPRKVHCTPKCHHHIVLPLAVSLEVAAKVESVVTSTTVVEVSVGGNDTAVTVPVQRHVARVAVPVKSLDVRVTAQAHLVDTTVGIDIVAASVL